MMGLAHQLRALQRLESTYKFVDSQKVNLGQRVLDLEDLWNR
jgi:hypothetical protein